MARAFLMGFALVAYAIFFATFLYLIAFVGDLPWVPLTVDRGPKRRSATAVVVDLALIALFGMQHSVMARQGFKCAWTRIVPRAARAQRLCPCRERGADDPVRLAGGRSRARSGT